jgi:hypothetical protein
VTLPLVFVSSEEAHASLGSLSDLEAGRVLGTGEGHADLDLLGEVSVDSVDLLGDGGSGVLDLLYRPKQELGVSRARKKREKADGGGREYEGSGRTTSFAFPPLPFGFHPVRLTDFQVTASVFGS